MSCLDDSAFNIISGEKIEKVRNRYDRKGRFTALFVRKSNSIFRIIIMSISRENISLWLQQSEPDYYLFFLRAWIPFNAWYVAEYPELKKKDNNIIKALQDDGNSKPKAIIQNFIDNSSFEGEKFKAHLSELHFQLEKVALNHNGKRLSFRKLSLTENPTKYKYDTDEAGNVYKSEKAANFVQAYIQDKSGKILLDFKRPGYSAFELERDPDYIRLDKKIQKRIFGLYEEIDPRKPISIISESSAKKDYLSIRSENPCKLIKDTETVSKACIKILYALRCMLFHGEVAPNETNKKIYAQAFYLLQLIIKELK